MENVIEIKNLRKTYRLAKRGGANSFEAVRGVSFAVKKGEIFGILGPNGAGKTTTLEIIEGLKQQTDGEVTVLGYNNVTQSKEVKRRIGVQLQTSEYLPHLTLGELLDLFASIYGVRADRKRLLSLVDLNEKEHEQVKNLSGGQKQRFTIATSLVNKPDIIFLDEPTTGLDPHARRQLWQLIKELNKSGITVMLTTHYMEEAEFLCHRVAIMDGGQILEIDEPQKLIQRMSDTTQVSFLTGRDIDNGLFKHIPEVAKVYSKYPKIILELKSLDKISAVVKTLVDNRIAFSGFMVRTATLEDVYLDLTGREYEED